MKKEIACRYCGKKFSVKGIHNHEKYCEKNPNTLTKGQVLICPKQSISLIVCGKYYRFVKNQKMKVPEKVAYSLEELNICEIL
ncbi:MAG: hypothetical protein H0Z24_05880 [Thermosipho sp. (in: Bacteria)]|nr:hypothetical protein [Thermosipho sp. (in: thermotogales)]